MNTRAYTLEELLHRAQIEATPEAYEMLGRKLVETPRALEPEAYDRKTVDRLLGELEDDVDSARSRLSNLEDCLDNIARISCRLMDELPEE